MFKRYLFVFFICTSSFLMAQQQGVKISISGIKKVKGDLMIAFYNKEADFLKSDKAVCSQVVKVNNSSMDVFFKELQKGEYAVAVIHDENSNKFLDTNFLGIPTEYIGTSNNIRNMFGPPSYNDSKFYFMGTFKIIEIKLY